MTTAEKTPPPLLTTSDVASMLGLSLSKLTWWVWALRAEKRYDAFEIKRRRGGSPRLIHAPIKPVKDVQRRLASILVDCYGPPSHVHGYVGTRGPGTNAAVHQRKQWVLRVDLADFFPSINFGRVRGMFMNYPFEYPPAVATLLAQICCHRNELPQGAPTSPVVSNLICRSMDKELATLASSERCHYTRYADDLCFSTDRTSFPHLLATIDAGVPTVGASIKDIVAANGFAVNDNKTTLMRRTQRQRVTGLVVNTKVNVSRDYVRGLQMLLHIWRRYGEADAAASLARSGAHENWPPGKPAPDFKKVVRGRVQHVGSIKGWTSSVYLGLAAELQQLDPDFRVRVLPPIEVALERPHPVRLFTEGATDPLHLQAAHEHFKSRSEFTEFSLEIDEQTSLDGDTKLLQLVRAYSRSVQSQPCVCVFDRDNSDVTQGATGGADWASFGNGVVAVLTVSPPWRDAARPLCIEMLYPDDVLSRLDDNRRRVFLSTEFDPQSGVDATRKFITPNIKSKSLVRDTVFEIETNKSVSRSKMEFASAVAQGLTPYERVDFEGFRPTFEAIRSAVRQAQSDLDEARKRKREVNSG